MKRAKVFAACAALASIAAAGCGNSGTPAANYAGEPYAAATTVQGDVRAGSRVLAEGHLDVTDFKGQRITQLEWNNGTPFTLNLPAGTVFPILLTAHPKGGATQPSVMKLVLVRPETDKISISERSTAIADKAAQLGGLTPDNVMAATLDSSGPSNPMGGGPHGESTQHYGGWH
jgi:hypothetical protein